MPRIGTNKEEIQMANTISEKTVVTSNTERKRRNVFNGTQTKLSVREQIPGYHLHVFTDTAQRIKEALDNGYEFVKASEVGGVDNNVVSNNGDLGDKVRFLVNPRSEGSEQFGYLMKIRQEWFDEDQRSLQEKNNQIDTSVRKGKITGENPSFYVPKGGISINTN